MPHKTSIRGNALLSSAGIALDRVFEFAFGIVLARLLAPADFGLLLTVQIFTGVAHLFAGGGLTQALVRHKTATEEDFNAVFSLQCLFCLMIYAAFFVSAPLLAWWYENEEYTRLVRVLSLSFLLKPWTDVPRAKLARDMNYAVLVPLWLLSTLVSGVAGIVLALLGFGVYSLVYAGFVATGVGIVVVYWKVRLPTRFTLNRTVLARHLDYGAFATVNAWLDYAHRQLFNLLVSKPFGPQVFGVFNRANSLTQIPVELMNVSLSQVLFSGLCGFQGDLDKSRYLYLRGVLVATVYTCPLFVVLWWLGHPIIEIVYGPQWLDAAEPLRVLSFSGLLLCVASQSKAVIAAQNRLRGEALIKLVNMGLAVLILPPLMDSGMRGIAWGLALLNVTLATPMIWLAARSLTLPTKGLILALLPALVLGAAMHGAMAVLAPWLETQYLSSPLLYCVQLGGVGCLVYLLGLLCYPSDTVQAEIRKWAKPLYFKA